MPPKGKKKAVKRESPDLECSFEERDPKSQDKKIRTNDHDTLDTEALAGPVAAQDDGLLSPGTLADIDAYFDGDLGLKPNKDIETAKVIQEDVAENQPSKKMIVEDCGLDLEEPPKEDPKPKPVKPAPKAEKKKIEKPGKKTARPSAITKATKKPET
jgi:hypothetical protein